MSKDADSTAIRAALWQALHTQIDAKRSLLKQMSRCSDDKKISPQGCRDIRLFPLNAYPLFAAQQCTGLGDHIFHVEAIFFHHLIAGSGFTEPVNADNIALFRHIAEPTQG